MPLTAKQQRFVEEYLVDLNGTQATIRAGYSRNTANRIAVPPLQEAIWLRWETFCQLGS
jgi:phage terminase small subunit